MTEEIDQNTFFNTSRRSNSKENAKSRGINKRVIFIIIGILILIGLVAFAIFATGGKGEIDILPTPTPMPTQIVTPTIQPTPTETILSTPAPTLKLGKTTPTPTPSKTTTPTVLERANLKIEVQNGSGIPGAATKASDILKKLGYDVVSSGNADNFEYTDTTIQVKSTKKAYLDLLKKDLSDTYTIGSATFDYTGTDADAIVIVGKN